MAEVTTLQRITVRARAGHVTRALPIKVRDTALVFELPGGAGTVEVDLAATPEGGLVIRAHQGHIQLAPDGATVVVRPTRD